MVERVSQTEEIFTGSSHGSNDTGIAARNEVALIAKFDYSCACPDSSALEKTRDERKHWKGQFQKLESKLDEYKDLDPDAIAESQKQIEADRKKLSEAKADNLIRSEMQKSGIADFMFEHVKAQMIVDSDTGNLLDKNDAPLLDDSGDAQTVETFVAGMRSDSQYAGVIRGSGQSGSNSQPGRGGEGNERIHSGQGLSLNQRRSDMTTKQKVEFVRRYGDERFQQLPL